MWLLFDAVTICYRAVFGMYGIELSQDQIRTEVLLNFLSSVLQAARRFETNNVAFCWDSMKSDRSKLYPQYKQQRKDKVKERTERETQIWEEAYKQISLLRSYVIPKMGFANNFIQAGKEADDIIARLCKNHEKDKLLIVSQDNDLFQLLTENISMWFFNKLPLFTVRSMWEKYQLLPHNWAEAKAIGGCDSDNIKGIPGFSDPKKPKSRALQYLRGELPTGGKLYSRLMSEEGRKIKERNLPLVKLPMEGTMDFRLNHQPLYSQDFEAVFEEFGFRGFLKNIREWSMVFRLF